MLHSRVLMDWEKAEKGPQISLFSRYHFTSSVKWVNNSTNTRDVCEDGGSAKGLACGLCSELCFPSLVKDS